MGVMGCSRKDCENVLCDTYIGDIGYICNDCKTEFKNYLESENLNPGNESQIRNVLDTFMNIRKDNYSSSEKIDVDSFFESYTS